MQKRVKIAYLLGTISLLGIASLAIAADESPATSKHESQMVVQIGPKGNATLRGTVDSVGSGTVTIKSWGGNWIINISNTTTVMPHETAANDLTDIKTGDFLGVQGSVNTSAPWTIDAKLVRDWTSKVTVQKEAKTNIREIRSVKKTESENHTSKTYEGKAGGVTATSFTLTTSGGAAYTVSIAPDTKLVNRLFRTVSASTLIQDGDRVRVAGILNGTALSAQVIRDISLPR